MARKPYNTQENTEKARKYRARRREQYAEYQRQYKERNYGSPTIRIAQVRQNIRNARANLQKWIEEEQELLIKQKQMQEAKAMATDIDQWVAKVVNEQNDSPTV